MELPDFLLPLRPVRPGKDASRRNFALTTLRGVASPPPARPPSLRLPITVPTQALFNWCWAAVASAITTYYREPYAAGQCAMAERWLQRQCCPPGEDEQSNPANSPYDLVVALAANIATASNEQISWETY